jgi:hypothetical protein
MRKNIKRGIAVIVIIGITLFVSSIKTVIYFVDKNEG